VSRRTRGRPPRATRASNERQGRKRDVGKIRRGRGQPDIRGKIMLDQRLELPVELLPAGQSGRSDRPDS